MLAAGRLDQSRTGPAHRLGTRAGPHPSRKPRVDRDRARRCACRAGSRQGQPAASRGIDIALAAQIGPDRAFADAAVARMLADKAVSARQSLSGRAGLRAAWRRRQDRGMAGTRLGHPRHQPPPVAVRPADPALAQDPGLAAFCAKVGLPPPDASRRWAWTRSARSGGETLNRLSCAIPPALQQPQPERDQRDDEASISAWAIHSGTSLTPSRPKRNAFTM